MPTRIALPTLICLAISSGTANVMAETIEGFSEPFSKVELAVVEPGLLDSVEVTEGDPVQPKQVLAKLNSDVLMKGLAIAEQKANATGAVLAAEAELRLRQGRLEQIRLLRKRGHASEHEYARALADSDIAEARLLLAREEKALSELEVDRIETQIERRIVRSPFEGVVSYIHKRVGESFAPGDTLVMTVVQLEKLKAKFALTPRQAESLAVGRQTRIVFPGVSKEANGTVEHISPVIDAKSGTIEVSVVIENKLGEYRSGARCLIDIELASDTREVSSRSSSK